MCPQPFIDKGYIKSAGTTTQTTSYNALDQQPYFPVTYYRVKQVDLNGDFTYTPTIAIQQESEEPLTVHQIYPNPTHEKLFVEFSMDKKEAVNVTITDLTGKIVHTANMDGAAANVAEIISKAWQSGMFFIRITTESGVSAITRVEKL